jgi:hypothetical protein
MQDIEGGHMGNVIKARRTGARSAGGAQVGHSPTVSAMTINKVRLGLKGRDARADTSRQATVLVVAA